MATPVKMARQFDQELEHLKQDLLRMAGLAETAVSKSMISVTNRNSDLAREVIIDDITLNRMELAIEEQAFKLLALRQPVATDLRLTAAAMRIATELERIGDQAVNIAERALELNSSPPLQLPIDIKVMADMALGMVNTSIDAFVTPGPQAGHQGLSAGCGSGPPGRRICPEDPGLHDQGVPLGDAAAPLPDHRPESGAHRRPGHQHRRRHRLHRGGPGNQASVRRVDARFDPDLTLA